MSLPLLSNEQLITRCRTYFKLSPHRDDCMCGFCVFNSLYVKRQKLMCTCTEPEWIRFSEVNLFPIGTFCAKCGLLHYTSLAENTFECEGCGDYFSYDFRQFLPPKNYDTSTRTKLPLPNPLCRRCDVPAPSVSSGIRRGFHIN